MESKKIRKLYLEFFSKKEHTIVDSAPIVIKDDPTLMFTNAGMNQFKHIFLSDSIPEQNRIANYQKCLRVSGKHNDLEEVGHDTYHHTMFEMLGSWSFGDYFKEEAITWAWEFLTEVCKLEKDRMYVTIFEGDSKLKKDNSTLDIWQKFVPKEKIIYGNKKDNFWEMGDVGPCGPCTEIHYDNRTETERTQKDGSFLVNKNHSQVIEIWNLVFIQFNRLENGDLKKLAIKHVDTGMGFERLAMIMQGVQSNYDTDIFQPVISEISKQANYVYGENEKRDIAIRVISDHIRAISFCIADGQLPSNTKSGYVIRRILRRAVRYAYTFLDLKHPFIYQLVEVLANQFKNEYKELFAQKEFIANVIKEEEISFFRTLEGGLKMLDDIIQKANGKISGKSVFDLYDTFGFPVDLTALILDEHSLTFDKDEFHLAMKKQKERSKKAGKLEVSDWHVIVDDEEEGFCGYDNIECDIIITRYREVKHQDRTLYHLVFNRTPFYPEGGGQIGDVGIISNKEEEINVFGIKKENNTIIHESQNLPLNLKQKFKAIVDRNMRLDISRNHTSTHFLHECLRDVLGEHVSQKGSLVHSDYLRFDFSHYSKLSNDEITQIEKRVNNKILENIALEIHDNISMSKAKELGAIMLFGEKYDKNVRMIQFGTSKELCGGTHVSYSGQIGVFKIISEVSISSGIRRIEALTGNKALEHLNETNSLVSDLVGLVKDKDVLRGVENLISHSKYLEKQLKSYKTNNLNTIKNDLLFSAKNINGFRYIAKRVDLGADELKSLSFSLRKEKNLFLVLGSVLNSKPILSIMLSDDLVKKGLNASNIIREISKEIDGGGGGQPFFATAGGSNPSGLEKALELSKIYIK